jgi:hypothetical protein
MIRLPNQAKLDFYQAEIDAHLTELEVELEKMKNEDLALSRKEDAPLQSPKQTRQKVAEVVEAAVLKNVSEERKNAD